MLFYRSALPLSRRTLNLAARTIRAHRKRTGSRWRRLDPAQQALLVLVHLYKGEPFTHLAAGFGVGTTTWRYVQETIRLLAEQAPTLDQGLRRAHRTGGAYVIVDGTRSQGINVLSKVTYPDPSRRTRRILSPRAGTRSADRALVSRAYRQAAAVPTSKSAVTCVDDSSWYRRASPSGPGRGSLEVGAQRVRPGRIEERVRPSWIHRCRVGSAGPTFKTWSGTATTGCCLWGSGGDLLRRAVGTGV